MTGNVPKTFNWLVENKQKNKNYDFTQGLTVVPVITEVDDWIFTGGLLI